MASNKKAVIFSFDVLLAVFLVIIVFSYAKGYNDHDGKSVSKMQLSYLMDDALIVLDKQGILDSKDIDIISSDISDIVPQNYGYKLQIYCESGGFFEDAKTVPADESVVSNEMVFYAGDNCRIKYWAWLI